MKALRIRRTEANLSQYRLAQLTGVSRHRLSMAECGYLTLTDDELKRLVDAVDQTIDAKRRLIASLK